MMLFIFLAGVVFVLVTAFLLKLMIFQETMSTAPKAQLKRIARNLPETSLPRLCVRKQSKRRIMCKSRSSGIIFKPEFKNKESAPKLVYMAYIPDSSTVVFFNDLYHTFESKTHHVASRLFEMRIPDAKARYSLSPPLHCKGLFVLPTANNIILVCNPKTKEVITLPQSSNKNTPRIIERENNGLNVRVGFGFVQSTQVYKVAQFFYRSYNLKEKRCSMGFEVFTIGASTCWRVLAQDPPYSISSSCWTFTGKCIYFYIWHLINRNAPNAFLCFNLKSEEFSLLYPPFCLKGIDVINMMLTNLQMGICLSVLSMNNTKFSVFTSKKGNNLDWTPRFSFNIVLEPRGAIVMPIVEYQGNILIRVIDHESQRLKYYDSKDGTFEEVNGELEDVKLEKEGFMLFLSSKPWYSVSSYEESLFKL